MTTTVCKPPSLPRLDKSYMLVHEQWRNIHFTDRGQSRLHHIAGFVTGLNVCGQTEQAEAMAGDLCRHLDQLNDYGGEIEIELADGGVLKCPRYRVVLCDDGTFGGFGILWYAVVHPDQAQQAKNALPIGDHERFKEWQERVAQANNWRTELELWRCYKPRNYREGERHETEYVQYRYAFNGGLLFHGFGCDPGAVVLGNCRFWSIHT